MKPILFLAGFMFFSSFCYAQKKPKTNIRLPPSVGGVIIAGPDKFKRGRYPLEADVVRLRMLSIYEARQKPFNPNYPKIYVLEEFRNLTANGEERKITSYYLYNYRVEFTEKSEIILTLVGDEDYSNLEEELSNPIMLSLQNMVRIRLNDTEKLNQLMSILKKETKGELLFHKGKNKVEIFPDGLPILWD